MMAVDVEKMYWIKTDIGGRADTALFTECLQKQREVEGNQCDSQVLA